MGDDQQRQRHSRTSYTIEHFDNCMALLDLSQLMKRISSSTTVLATFHIRWISWETELAHKILIFSQLRISSPLDELKMKHVVSYVVFKSTYDLSHALECNQISVVVAQTWLSSILPAWINLVNFNLDLNFNINMTVVCCGKSHECLEL